MMDTPMRIGLQYMMFLSAAVANLSPYVDGFIVRDMKSMI